MPHQSTSSKASEIRYRAKILEQHLGKRVVEKNEPTSGEFKQLMSQKLKLSNHLFKKLQKQSYHLSPFLEIGSEHALRPALLESKFGAQGFASDISFYSLSHAKEYAKMFKFKKPAMAICADAYNLPFKSNSFPFVFLYETLHHFPDPKPVLMEANRVLAPGGICLIGSDPIKQSLQLSLWYRPNKLRVWEKILKYILILPFISHIGKTEVEKGILEGAFSLKTWKKSLSMFEEVEATIRAFPLGPEQKIFKTTDNKWVGPNHFTNAALYLFGGGILAICRKKGSYGEKIIKDIHSFLICPECKMDKKIETNLKQRGQEFFCNSCKNTFVNKNNVLVLLQKNLHKKILSKV